MNILKLLIEAREALGLWEQGNARGRAYIVFLDLRRAFDSCDHALLFRDKLSRARFPT